MKSKAIYGEPVIESVTITMTKDEARLLHRFVSGATSNTVVDATGLQYGGGDDEMIYSINDVLFGLHEAIGEIKDLDLPQYYR